MSIKRKDRETDGIKSYCGNHVPSDREVFLQAFEKPTQIYRYLKSRHTLSPIFLHRNLSYMKERMSRKRSRKDFRVDSLLSIVTNRNRIEAEKNACPNNYLTVMFLGIYDKSMPSEQAAEVSIILSKISHMKRKDSFTKKQNLMGTAKVKINPIDMIGKIPAISLPSEEFKPAGTGSINRSCILQIIVNVLPAINESPGEIYTSSYGDQAKTTSATTASANAKIELKTYETELLVFDKYNRCSLSDGEYELTLTEHKSASPKTPSPKKHPTWEIIPESCLDEFNGIDSPINDLTKNPLLKFRLAWTKEQTVESVDRPLPITIRKEDHFISNNKENESVIENNLGLRVNNYSGSIGGGAGTIGMAFSSNNPNASESNANSSNNNNNNNNNNSINGNLNSAIAGSTTVRSTTTATLATATTFNAVNNVNISLHNSNSIISISNNNTVAIVKLHDIASRIIYHFIYNNNSSQQTETFDNFNCPWCCLHCLTLYALLKHLKLCHARFNFTYVPLPNGVRVDVSINELFDGSYTGSPNDLVGPAGSAFARTGPVRRTTVTRILVCRPRRPKQSLTEFLEIDENELNAQRPYIQGHNRLYYHTLTCLPVHPKDLDVDSEGENDPPWLQQKTKQMIDEFTDVNEGEKELMKMWNLHIMREGYVGEIQIPLACEMFIDLHANELLEKNLYKNFVLHMCNLSDYGLVTSDTLYKTIQKLQRVLSTYEAGRAIMSAARANQLDFWFKVGIHKQKQLQNQQPQTVPPLTPRQKRRPSQTQSNAAASKSRTMKTNDSEGEDDDDDDDEGVERNDEKMETSTSSEQLSKSKESKGGQSAKKNSIKATDNGIGTHKRRKSTILPAQEEIRSINSIKRKATHPRGDSPPRRRSASAALGATNIHASGTRRNSATNNGTPALKKRKRMPLSMSKNGK